MPNQDSKSQIREQLLARNDPAAQEPVQKAEVARKPYQFLMIPTLRDYLGLEFQPERALPFPYDPERIIDDFGSGLLLSLYCQMHKQAFTVCCTALKVSLRPMEASLTRPVLPVAQAS